MKVPRIIPPPVRDAQARASDPAASAFVSANAGSGKTHVLVQRVIRLLLSGVPPEKILCLTFTKAAAANMSERVFTTLGHWVTLDDEKLDAAIMDAGIAQPTAKLRRSARELFASALETPGGLKVQTIHALCTRLLQQFPFEANVPARFAVLDDRDQAEMMERASLAVMLDASRDPDSAIGLALRTAMASAADVTFKEILREACLSRDHFMAWADAARSADAAGRQVSEVLGLNDADRLDDIEREIVEGPNLPRGLWQRAADALAASSNADQKQAARLMDALRATDALQVDEYLGVFLTDAKAPRDTVVTNNFRKKSPDLGRRFDAEIGRLPALIEKRRALLVRDRTEALLRIAIAVAANYRREKRERGLLDYDDLIDRTLALLASGAAAWVHYKLDRGVDHVLIDEAQDTSPRQWDIIAHIISEFTTGAGARDSLVRTVFAVGDEKQSIFSFQGAAPREFDARRSDLKRKFEEAKLKFESIPFNYSFRSGRAILQSVDHVFREEEIYRSIHAEKAYPLHEALPDAGPSQIDLWELAVADDKQDIEGWRAPFDGVPVTSAEVKLSKRIQAEIKRLVTGETMTGHLGDRRRLRYGDVLVLVRRRGNLFDAVIQALKHAAVPVAGADRLKLTEHIAIIDLMNLADAVLLPQDDLALAVALKSPLFGLTEDELFTLAWNRQGSLRTALAAQAAGNDRLKAALDRLMEYERRSRIDTPFEFYAWVLGGDDGRARMLRRLGHEANDALDEFLELALSYEKKAPASLQGFLAWLRAADTEVKRDMEISRDEVRVMTVHGAKGLEASVVIMADTTTSPTDTQRLRLVHVPRGNGGKVVVWAGRKADDPPAVADARNAMLEETEHEYRRLLYVAMTRAADRLIVAGCMPGNRNSVREHSWYDLVKRGLERSDLVFEEIPAGDGVVKSYRRADTKPVADIAADIPARAPPPLPDWLRVPVAPEHRAAMLRPSDSGEDDGKRFRTGESLVQRSRALQRGVLVHRLLQSLPDLAADRRRDLAIDYLARNSEKWTKAERADLAEQVLALIAEPRFAAVFAAGSCAEVPIVGRLEGRLVSGQIDRLVVTETEILIVDYKTNHAPPATPEDAPQGYVRQLALYRAVLSKLYPQRPVRAALLWTETPDLMEISATALDAALSSLREPP